MAIRVRGNIAPRAMPKGLLCKLGRLALSYETMGICELRRG